MPKFKQRERTDYIVFHCSATPPSQDIGAQEINGMHLARGWSGIGYHYVVRRNGDIELGRPLWAVGAHVKGFNTNSVAVCWVGGVNEDGEPEDNRTPVQKEIMAGIAIALKLTYREAQLKGHRDFSPDVDGDGEIEEWEWMKACPCFDVEEWWESVRPDHIQ